jgi:hypothetical protein
LNCIAIKKCRRVKKGISEHDRKPKIDYCLLKPRKTNFGKRWMNENKHPYSLGHRGMKGDHKDEKFVMPSKILWKGGIWEGGS